MAAAVFNRGPPSRQIRGAIPIRYPTPWPARKEREAKGDSGIALNSRFGVYLTHTFGLSLQEKLSTPATIIVVEDDPGMGRALMRHLTRAGYRVAVATSGAELRRLYRHDGADLVLLDLNLGAEDGMDLARELIGSTAAAVMIVSGRDDLQDRIDGLDAGADDYITKPFAVDELLARVRAVLRRHAFDASPRGAVRLGEVTLDPSTMTLSDASSGVCLRLTEMESRILATLMRQQGRTLSRAQLLNRDGLAPEDRTVDVHIGNIRRKLRDAGVRNLVIWPVRGHGYRLRLENG